MITPPPALHTLYFEEPDEQGHEHGPHSPEAKKAVQKVDAALGRLRAKMGDTVWDATNIVIVADHGMADVSTSRVVYLMDDCGLNPADVAMTGSTTSMGLWARNASTGKPALEGPGYDPVELALKDAVLE
mmetsp:Transcript_40030/g.99054  ORF Transcript_40030/g.99054 Transcript_40030/m.99054 type:complete len:130 (-) Transcript_40030:357-746(-)